ncbi:MAG: hypothetical protein ACF8R7_00705 [Phycisphaerales bacterium JB039]
MSDPLRLAGRRELTTLAIGAGALALAAAWSALPVEPARLDLPALAAQSQLDEGPAEAPFNLAAFEARIWNPRPIPVAPAVAEARPAPPAPQPLRLQLIAIVREGEQLAAALYDPEADELRLARPGDSIARHTITLVDASGVELQPPAGALRRIDLIVPGETP